MPAPRMRVTDFAVRGSLSSKLVATRTPSRRQSGWPSLSTLCPARSAFDGRPSPVHRKGLVDTHSVFGEIGVHGIHPPPRGKAAGGHAGGRSALLLGARQTGKTTLAQRLNPDMQLNFIRPEIRQRYERRPQLLGAEIE